MLHFITEADLINNYKKKIHELPLEWFFGCGKVIDLSFISKGELIEKAIIEKAVISQQIEINPMDIVLIYTGMDKYWGTEEYFSNSIGLSKEAIHFLLDFNIKVIGIDSYGFDRSISKMVNDYNETKKIRCFMAFSFLW
ncbi:cyclase family protein [Listeria aquatica FSL S10-1188]|uniref:Cyclase family protein n=1 Tax=Listeria aquatica FSL S10-1188 TaxID=1265818 RepID=W7B271_9LIST|nr:cyclase family protein [Listeria aquatica]EUJ19987.1 cyclase family protein [Listeria aquatica FSL S10-1188]